VDFTATPSGRVSMLTISIRMDGLFVTQTFAPESAIDVAEGGREGVKPITVMGWVWCDAV